MHPQSLFDLLQAVAEGGLSPADAVERLKRLPYEDLGFAKLDHHRALRTGFGEVVFGSGKTDEQIHAIVERIVASEQNALVTRTTPAAYEMIHASWPAARWHTAARCLTVTVRPPERTLGRISVVCAGTSDIPVAEEAAVTAEFHGAHVDRHYDVGVAGLHRILDRIPDLRAAHVVIVAAGMEGALPSVVAGLIEAPVIAVPTSVGYGAAFEGLTALLAMLNSCASGVSVVNIDNGFGAGYLGTAILRMATRLAAQWQQ